MKGFVQNIETLATKNTNFRRVLYTAKNCQLVVMSLLPSEEIGMEVHKLDQFFRVEEGSGEAILDGVRSPISAGFAVLGATRDCEIRLDDPACVSVSFPTFWGDLADVSR